MELEDIQNSQASVSSHVSESEHEEPLLTSDDRLTSAIDTFEALPSTQFYRSMAVPRVGPKTLRSGEKADHSEHKGAVEERVGGKYGTFSGVFLRCFLNIISVVFYLRLGWVVGNCGLGLSYALILVCSLATFMTALSLSALSTNGTVKGGGIYYFISRSLGPDFGGTIGVVFSFATTFGTVLHVYGFIEVVRDLIGKNITKDGKFDIPIIGISLATVLVVTVSISLAWEFIMQYILAILIGVSVIATLFGWALPSNPHWTIENLKNNWKPDFRDGNDFFSIFAVFFPACTGIMAGANISGDLKDPQKSIPLGTLSAIGATTLLYMVIATILAAAGDREQLHYNSQLMAQVCLWKYLVTAGVLAASISSASAALVGGPKIFQALCKDDILPRFFRFFAVGKKSSGDPIRGFILAWVIIVICTFIFKDLNAVGICMSQFFLISYAIVCQSCLVGVMSKSPSWRPAWKYYHPITAILGAALCVVGMFLTDWIFALCVLGVTILIFMYFHWSDRANMSNWGDFPQALLYTNTVTNLGKLREAALHVKTYRPQIEFIVDYDFGSTEMQLRNFTPFKHIGSQACGLVIVSTVGAEIPDEPLEGIKKVFTRSWGKIDLTLCARLIGTAGGIGKVSPNILALPFVPSMRNATNIFDMVGAAFDNHLAVAISRGFESYDPKVEHRWPIDVWWLSDDGGLIILLGYLLSQHKQWKRCKIRVITVITKQSQLTEASMRMTRLLKMFRINAEVIVLAGLDQEPSPTSLQHWREFNIEVTEEPLVRKIHTFLRLRDLLLEHSGHSSMVVCTLPIPRATADPAMWLGLIDIVSDAMPPFIWVHGNNENVVTFMA